MTSTWEIVRCLRSAFRIPDTTYFPLHVPVGALNPVIGLEMAPLASSD